MCEYCECRINEDFPSLGNRGRTIASDNGGECYIEKVGGAYYIAEEAYTKSLSKQISYCPFCGRKLTTE